MLTDTHAHLDFPDFAGELPAMLTRAAAAGVERIVTIGTTLEGSQRSIALAETNAQVFATIGVHPSNAIDAAEDVTGPLRALAQHPRVVAIGECGLDYHRLPSSRMHEAAVATAALGNETAVDVNAAILDGAAKEKQAVVFQQQLDLAAELRLPVVVHERDAWDDTLALLAPYTGRVRAVFHCFGKSLAQAREVLALGHLVGFTGIVTFKNAQVVQDAAAQVPAGSFMVETDCPYLAPVPHRGKRCEPAHVRETASYIAQLRGVSLEQIAAETTATSNGFFRFPTDGIEKGLRMIALAEGAKGALVLLVGLGLVRMAIGDQAVIADQIVAQFHLNPAHKFPHIFLKAAKSSDAKLYMFAAAATFYSAVRFAEMWGLWFQRRWAEWVTAIGAALYIPIEVYELTRSITAVKVCLLSLNVLIVIYLCLALQKRNGA